MAELTNPQNTPEPDGATLTIDSTSDLGTLYSYSKTAPFTGTDEENAAEIMANGVGQGAVVGTNTRVVTGQDQLTDYYAGWVQDSDGYGGDMVLAFNMGAGETLTIPGGAGTYLFDIDWGDGTVETGLTTQGAGPHTYTDAIEAVVRISGVFPHVYFNNTGDKHKVTEILQLGDVGAGSFSAAFYGCESITKITIGVHDAGSTTQYISALRKLTGIIDKQDLRGFLPPTATNISYICNSWANATEFPDVTDWPTSNIVTAAYAFAYLAKCKGKDLDVDTWDVSSMATLTGFLLSSGVSTACYDRILASWGNQTLAAGAASTTIHFGNSTYTDQASKDLLLAQVAGIIDGGVAP